MKHLKDSLIATALIASLSACGGSGDETVAPEVVDSKFDFTAGEMITNLTYAVIVQGYANLAVQGESLYLVTQTLVNTPTAANFAAVQRAWQAARQPWEQGESHIFGPVDSLGIDPHLDSWPLNTRDLTEVLINNSGFDANTVKGWNDDVQGFHTMEYLLFGDGIDDNQKSIAAMTLSEREYLMALAEVFRDYAQVLDDAWQISHDGQSGKAYAELVNTAGEAGNTFYSSKLGVIQELINGMIGIVDEVGNGKIADPLGISIATADTSKVESQYSWNSLTDFSDNIIGVRNIYQGEFSGAADQQGIVDFVAAADADLATRVGDEIDDAIVKILAISGANNLPFRQALSDTDGRARVQIAIDALSKLQASLESDVLPLLNNWNAA